MDREMFEKLMAAGRPEHDGDAFSLRHPRMDRAKRAKIFQPFDALRGFSAEIDIAADDAVRVESGGKSDADNAGWEI